MSAASSTHTPFHGKPPSVPRAAHVDLKDLDPAALDVSVIGGPPGDIMKHPLLEDREDGEG